MTLAAVPFGTLPDGRVVHRFTLESASGVSVHVLTLGGIITSIRAPDRHGAFADIVLGHDTVDGYLDPRSPYFGAIVGRYANRIAQARFTLDGVEHHLAANLPPHALHGGTVGFDKALWGATPRSTDDGTALVLRHTSPDGDEGYPGRLDVEVTYHLDDHGRLTIDFGATADRATPVNLVQHSYFNLAGHDSGDVTRHELTIRASHYTPVDDTGVPTGAIAEVAATPFDFRRVRSIASGMIEPHQQLLLGSGYDHNFVLDRASDDACERVAFLRDPGSGRTLEVSTTEPGLQLYTANFLDQSLGGKGGARYAPRAAVCLETQHFPDSPNQPHFPSTVLRPGARHRSRTVWAFGVDSRAGG